MQIAVCLFAYNRPKYLKKALKTHKKIEGLGYYAFVDKSNKQKEVIDIIHDTHLYNIIIPRQEHYGLNRNIREGIDWVLRDHDAVIVLEDDLLLADDAFEYLISGVNDLAGRTKAVSCDKGFNEHEFKCWAWAMLKEDWYKIDWSLRSGEKNDNSWDMIVSENFERNKWWCDCSPEARVKHIGKIGTHYNLLGYIKEAFNA